MIMTAVRDSQPYKTFYYGLAGAMAAGFVAVLIVGLSMTWHHEVLILEGIEATAFAVFWFLQTIQLWDIGVPAPSLSKGFGPPSAPPPPVSPPPA